MKQAYAKINSIILQERAISSYLTLSSRIKLVSTLNMFDSIQEPRSSRNPRRGAGK